MDIDKTDAKGDPVTNNDSLNDQAASDAKLAALDSLHITDDVVGGVDVCGTSVDASTDQAVTSGCVLEREARAEPHSTDAKLKIKLPCLPSQSDRAKETEPDFENIRKPVENTEKADPDYELATGNLAQVSRLSDSYDMNHKKRGYALVINQEKFSRELQNQGYTRRTGTAVDERNITRRLQHLGFDVTSYPDLTGNQIRNICIKMADKDHSDCDCFVCVILSHGEEGVIFGTDKAVPIEDLASYFKGDRCPSLIGKPKLFIIQACRGYQTDPGVGMNVSDAKGDADSGDARTDSIKLPVEADFLFAYSTVPGFYSWRNGANGSWFIQAISDVLEKLEGSIEIRKLLTKVNRKVAQNFQSWNPGNDDFHEMKQIPCITSMLTKDLVLSKKKKRY